MPDFTCYTFIDRSAVYIALISLIPSPAVGVGVTVISTLFLAAHFINEIRPRKITENLDKALQELNKDFYDALECHLLGDSSCREISLIEIRLRSIRPRAAQLRKVTLGTSLSPWREIKEVFKGHLFHLLVCLWDVRVLKVDLEIAKAEEEQRQYGD